MLNQPNKTVLLNLLVILLLFNFSNLSAQESPRLSLIPYPTNLIQKKGFLVIDKSAKISVSKEFKSEVNELNELLKKGLGGYLKVGDNNEKATIRLVYDPKMDAFESYRLDINTQQLIIRAKESAGVFYAIETIRQLLPEYLENETKIGKLKLPALTIEDKPAYAWRGMMLDVSRHFFSINYVKKFIDRMALYKMNKLHLHLTDDQGWRVEIKKYPKLTEQGAWRTFDKNDTACMKKSAENPDFTIDKEHIVTRNGKTLYGGFYTQKQLKDLVSYALSKNIDIIPEVDMPGHMMAAINAYPFLTCNGENTWGTLFTKPICPCNEQTFEFAQNVFSEIMDIFPSKYIHIGGDEVDRSDWAKSDACKAMMQQNGIKDLAGLHSYFINRMEKFFNSKGRKLIGWDEVLEGGISPSAIIMYWRTWVKKAPVEAVKNGNTVIMSPGEPLYFDYPADQYSINKVYHFNPIPAVLNEREGKSIIGAQANLWSEMIPSERRADFMTMPRMTALAEQLWTNDTTKYASYLSRLTKQYARMEAMNINYRLPDLPNLLNNYVFTNETTLSVKPPLAGLIIRYTTNGNIPETNSPALPASLKITKSQTIKLALFTAKGTRGDVSSLEYTKRAISKAVNANATKPGLQALYYKSFFKETKLMQNSKVDSVFTTNKIEVPSSVTAPSFGITYKGYIDVPTDGTYSFFLTCDDGGILNIDNYLVVDNDGNHSARERSGQMVLTTGKHLFKLDFIEGGGGYKLKLMYSLNGSVQKEVPESWFKY